MLSLGIAFSLSLGEGGEVLTCVKLLSLSLFLSFSGSLPVTDLRFGGGEGEVFLGNVHCQGTEERLVDCPSNPTNCSHTRDVGVRCQGN